MEADVELLLVALSHCGFALRRDDPRALGEIVKLITSKASLFYLPLHVVRILLTI